MPKVSVIIPTYHRAQRLQIAVKAVLHQTLAAHEIIIIDDGSHATAQQEVKQIVAQSPRCRLLTQPTNLGTSACRNRGMGQATGEFLLFLDDDDQIHPTMLAKSLAVMQTQQADVTCCRAEVVDEHHILPRAKFKRYNQQKAGDLSQYNLTTHPTEHIFFYHPPIHTFLVRRSIIGDSHFPEALQYGEDFAFWFALAARQAKFVRADFIGAHYHFHADNCSTQLNFEAKRKFYQYLPHHFTLSREARHLLHFKMSFLSLRHGDPSGIVSLAKSLQSPPLCWRHAKHYLSI